MAKLTLLLASFAFFLLVANASIYRTTVEIDDESTRGGQSCQEQSQQQQQLRHCQLYLRQRMQQSEGQLGGRDNQQQQYLRQCCQQLRQLDPKCRCPELEQAVRSLQQQGGGQEMEEELYETASNIPKMCKIKPRQGCRFSSSYESV